MSAIEEKIIKTLCSCSGEGVKKLSCRDSVKVKENRIEYFLWDNLVFWNVDDIYYFTSHGWNSRTTKNRLNAILYKFFSASITQKNYKWVLNWNGKKYPIDSESIFMFKGNKLYKLGSHEEEVKPL